MADETPTMLDPVTLSAGPLGGETVEWPKASFITRAAIFFGASADGAMLREFEVDGVQCVYRREGDVAIFAGTDQ